MAISHDRRLSSSPAIQKPATIPSGKQATSAPIRDGRCRDRGQDRSDDVVARGIDRSEQQQRGVCGTAVTTPDQTHGRRHQGNLAKAHMAMDEGL
jgi:hypothetical protein